MRLIIQRVSEASVSIEGQLKSKIGNGLLVLIGIENNDTTEDISWLTKKLVHMRIFEDEFGKMNHSLLDVDGDLLLVSQFTLHASTKKGNRPSYIKAAAPSTAIPLYNEFIKATEKELGKSITTGEFGSNMKVTLINDGPVTIFLDSKQKE